MPSAGLAGLTTALNSDSDGVNDGRERYMATDRLPRCGWHAWPLPWTIL